MKSLLSLLLLGRAVGGYGYSFEPLEHLAGIAPYFEPQDPPLDPAAPQGCKVTKAAYLVRHAAIYANDFDYEEYIEPFISKLQNASSNIWLKSRALSFLSTWLSPIQSQDQEQLTQVGMLEAQTLGVQVSQRYLGFRPPKEVWSSTAERTTKSAQAFIQGLVRNVSQTTLTLVSEGEEEGANSLTPYESCPAYSSSRGSKQSEAVQTWYTQPILARFQAEVPSFNFTSDDIVGMQELCGYETVIRGSSPFCSLALFTPDDWLGFEYTNDVMYFHNTGYGNWPLNGAIGLPWVAATADLLLAANNSSDTQDLYVSFTHRELPPTVLVALGLFNNSAFSGGNDVNATMPTANFTIDHRRAWKSSHILPFLTNIAMERLECRGSYGFADGAFVRVLVNQSPQPLDGCVDGPGSSCSLDGFRGFVEARKELFGGYGAACGVDYANSTDVLGIYGS